MKENNSKLVEKAIYCSFLLNHSEFALSVSFVQEVINTPEDYSTMPLSPTYLKGLINLRGMVIPVIDLKKVLNLKDDPNIREQKIAIIYLHGNLIGLLFDKTGEVFSANEDEQSNFSQDSNSDSVIRGVFKKDNGKRIIQILDVESIFCLKNIPKRTDNEDIGKKLKNSRGRRRQAISFVVGNAKCALEINEIQEILMLQRVNESALAVGNCIGTFDLRGATVPVIDFAALLKYRDTDLTEGATTGDRRIVVMKIGKELFGLLVDCIDSIITFYDDDLKHFPTLLVERMNMIKGCISIKNNTDALLLDEKQILTESEIVSITHGHSKLYNTSVEDENVKNSKSGKRRTFITFSIEQEYAISIADIREIIDLPTNMMNPPGMADHYRGIYNLRGEMVMIVDSRIMYNKGQSKDNSSCKVLIFKTDGIHFGLIVDSVQSIISFSDNDKLKLPEMMYRDRVGESKIDIVEAVQYTSSTKDNNVALILDVSSIAKRVLEKVA